MINIAILILVAIFSLLESSFFNFLLVPLMVLPITLLPEEKNPFPLLFLMGIIYDLILVYPLGSSSLFFLILFLVITLYQKKYSPKNIVYLFIFSFLAVYLTSLFKSLNLPFYLIVLNSFLIFLLYPLIKLLINFLNNSKSFKIKL